MKNNLKMQQETAKIKLIDIRFKISKLKIEEEIFIKEINNLQSTIDSLVVVNDSKSIMDLMQI